MGSIKNISIKIENGDSLNINEFDVAKESGYRGVQLYNSVKKEREVYIVDWKDEELVVDSELINTYGGNFIYRDVFAYLDTDTSLFTLHESQYGQCDNTTMFEIDDNLEIRDIILGL
jgi:hypothetical protein